MTTETLHNEGNQCIIDARGVYYRDLNALLRARVSDGFHRISLSNVCGQRYIATDLPAHVQIEIHGTPGNDLGAFMDGPAINVCGNVQDGCGNTMNSGRIVVHGRGGDILGMSMRGGSIFVRDDAGYRCAIHMKEYRDRRPTLVIGGTAQDFFAEYMAGGIAVLLGLTGVPHEARFVGTGMHGGAIYIRGEIKQHQLGKEVGIVDMDEEDRRLVREVVEEYTHCFGGDSEQILSGEFLKLAPVSSRPYGKLYTY